RGSMSTERTSRDTSTTTETRTMAEEAAPITASTTADMLGLQRAIKNPSSTTLTPAVISHLQRTHGNAFVHRLIAVSQPQVQKGAPSHRLQREPSALSSFHRMKPDEKQQFERCLYGGSPSAGVILRRMLLQRLEFNLAGFDG